MIVWGGRQSSSTALSTGAKYNPVTNTWTAIASASAPSARWLQSAVWTGTEMIVWGGQSGASFPTTGGRYKPSTNTWTATSNVNPPAGRAFHMAVWSGIEMLIWGGATPTGARYNPSTNGWTAIPLGGPANAAGVWTGSEMIAWSGLGGKYSPATNLWVPIGIVQHPPELRSPSAVWTGTEAFVWGAGYSFGSLYNPTTNSWRLINSATAPSARSLNTAVWTGTQIIVWGGVQGSANLGDGGRYDPTSDSWTPISMGPNAPSPRFDHTAVWTGSEMIIWGGSYYPSPKTFVNTGSRYNPQTDTWAVTISAASTPSPRSLHTAVWTGKEMIIWGGLDHPSELHQLDTGGRYDPVSDTWVPTSTGIGVPSPRELHKSVWTGSQMLTWGGYQANVGSVATGGRYDPVSDSWSPIAPAPSAVPDRYGHSEIWTGREMIVWGGIKSALPGGCLEVVGWTGGRYDPVTDTWRVTSIGITTPAARLYHGAVWTGAEMVIWGGVNNDELSTGGSYCAAPCLAPSGIPNLLVTRTSSGSALVSWDSISDATTYDLVRGTLSILHSSGGSFALATQSCLGNGISTFAATDAGQVQANDGNWYLVRAVNCSVGTYNDGTQVSDRDSGIAASPLGCP